MPFLQRHSKSLLALLLIVLGAIIIHPFLHFQEYLSQGDHGRDLYAAEAVYRGELPYKDFWWVYGPLMPYYYGLFYKVFGVQISSIILGKFILKIAAGFFIYLAMAEIVPALIALLTACWFIIFHQDFFFTYNHIGGIVMLMGVAYCLMAYIRQPRLSFAWGTLAFIFILGLIKINFGAAALAVSCITIAVVDLVRRVPFNTPKKLFYAFAVFGVPLLLYVIYWSLLKNLSIMEIRQCLPYLGDDQPYNTTPWASITLFIKITWQTMSSGWMNRSFAVIIILSLLRTIDLFVKEKTLSPKRLTLLLSIAMLSLFYVADFHEYIKSGVWYRSFWSQPLSMMLSFLIINTAAQSVIPKLRWCLWAFIGILTIISCQTTVTALKAVQTEPQHLTFARTDIYTTNAPAWIETVKQTTDFLNKTLKPDELFFALPYDCLYYYLTGKKTPTRQLIFFEHIKIPLSQEKSIIAELEKNHVNYVLVSSRAYARQEYGLGLLGQTYCPLIGAYIKEHFAPIAQFGDWTNEPGWAWNHGTVILKRK